MRITLFWSYYPTYISDFYSRHGDLASKSYAEQVERISGDYFGWPMSLAQRMAERGHQVQFLLVNVMPLQRAWCQENDVAFDERQWQFSLPIEQVRRFRPDVLWIGSMFR